MQLENPIPDDQAIFMNSSVSLWLIDSSPAASLLPEYGFHERSKSLLQDLTLGVEMTGPHKGLVPIEFCGKRDFHQLFFLNSEGFIMLDEVKGGWLLHPFLAYQNEEMLSYSIEKFKEIRLKPFQKFGYFKYKSRFDAITQKFGAKVHENMGANFLNHYWKDQASPEELLCDSETYTEAELAEDAEEEDDEE